MQLMKTISFLFVLSFLTSFSAFSQTNTAISLEKELVSHWLVKVSGEARTRTLVINGVAQQSDAAFLLDAAYGYTDEKQTGIRAEISQIGQERRLNITTQANSIITAIETPGKSFVGTFTNKNGATKDVTIEKISEADLQKLRESGVGSKGAIVKPSADVPESCAAFSGKWLGKWGYGIGQSWLWVVNIDAKCNANIAYLGTDRTPSSFITVEIRDGKLEFLCNKSTNGTCIFKRSGNDLTSNYHNPSGGTNFAYFEKIQ